MKGRDTHVGAPEPEIGQIVSEYEFIVEQVRQAVWRLDSTGKVIEANRSASRWLETSLEELVGKNVRELTVGSVDMVRDETFEAEFLTSTGIKRAAVVSSRVLRHENGMVLGALQVVTDVTGSRAIENRLVKEVQKMARMAGEDPLTGLPNRRAFDMVLESAVAGASQEPFALLLVDLNDFKPINDQFGHEAGDIALKEFASRLDALARGTDFVARIGGDEFAVVLANTDAAAAEQVAARYCRSLDFELLFGGRSVRLWCAVGVAHSKDGAATVLSRADLRMYEGKKGQKGSVARNESRLGLA